MSGAGRLYYQYNKNRDGTVKNMEKVRPKLINSFTVDDVPDDGISSKNYVLNYEFSSGFDVNIAFFPEGFVIEIDGNPVFLTEEILRALAEVEKKY